MPTTVTKLFCTAFVAIAFSAGAAGALAGQAINESRSRSAASQHCMDALHDLRASRHVLAVWVKSPAAEVDDITGNVEADEAACRR